MTCANGLPKVTHIKDHVTNMAYLMTRHHPGLTKITPKNLEFFRIFETGTLYTGTSITGPRMTRRPVFHDEFPGARRDPHRDNASKCQIIGRVTIRRPTSTDALLLSRGYTAANVVQEPNSVRRLRHSPLPIRGLSLAFA